MISVGKISDYWDGAKLQLPPHAAYIGRAAPRRGLKASPLANPFKVGGDIPTVEDAVAIYRIYLSYRPLTNTDRLGEFDACEEEAELSRLRALHEEHGKLLLLCWCENWDGEGEAPGKCHGEVIRDALLDQEQA